MPPLAAGYPALLLDVWPPGGPWPPRPPFCGPLWYPPAPLPRCAAGSCPDSHSGGGTGLGVGGGGGFFSFGSFGAAWVGMTDSSRARCSRSRRPLPPWRCAASASVTTPCWRWRSGGPQRRPKCSHRPPLSDPVKGTPADQRILAYLESRGCGSRPEEVGDV